MDIWLVSLFDPTPLDNPIYPRFIEIAKKAQTRGHNVIHFTSTFRHTVKKHRFNSSQEHVEHSNYKVVFTKSLDYKNNFSPRRFYAHRDYAKKLLVDMKGRKRPAIVFVSMPPISVVYQLSRWAKSMNIPIVVDIIDPWPDSFIKDVPARIKPFSRLLIAPFYRKIRQSFERCSAITAISNGYLEWASSFHKKDKRTAPFYLAIDLDAIQQEQKQIAEKFSSDKGDKLRLIYAGSLASSYDIPTILAAAVQLYKTHGDKIVFTITGNGPQKELIYKAQKQCQNIDYLGFVSKEELIKQYYLADLGLVQHKNNLTQTITYKFFNYMSCDMPLLNSLQSEMADLIDKHDLGMNNMPGDVERLIENILKYYNDRKLLETHSKNAIEFTREFGDTKTVYGRLVEFLEEIATNK